MPTTATRESEAFWAAERPDGGAWLAHYQASASAAWRETLIVALGPSAPFASVLEVGCHCGPNLHRLREAFPACPYTGWDVNPSALAYGRQWAIEAGLDETTWLEQSALTATGANQFDLVLASSCLSTIAPEDLDAVLLAVTLRSSRIVAIQEPTDERHNGVFHQWGHDYLGRLTALGVPFTWTVHGDIWIGERT